MSKNVVIAILAILLLGGGVFFFLNTQKSETPTPTNNPVTSIKDALSQSMSLTCTYKEDNGRESKVYIKNGAIRSDYTGTSAEQSGSMIMKDKKLYMWNGKEGYVMDIPDVTETPQETEQNQSEQEKLITDLEKYKDYCKAEAVSDSFFVPPADVTFTDYAQMLEQNSQMTEEQMQQYMQQYSNPQ